ncbi:MAG: Cof-type HAD-IIB family hydrolase [Lautropia sp.]|nr:Cof-type HAD-IIB family hydrolase [Lautropia sp.]
MSAALQKNIKIVFFDIDDTIYSKVTGLLASRIEQAFEGLRQRGIVPAIASGRARYIFPAPLEAVIARQGLRHFVTINGQLNLRAGEPVSHYPVAPADVDKIAGYFNERDIAVGFAGARHLAVSRIDERLTRTLDPITRDYTIDPAFFRSNPVYQLIVFYPSDDDASVAESGVLDGGSFKTVRWAPEGVDILDQSGSKIRGIHDVVSAMGLTLDNVMVFGDSLNDIEMLSQAGFAVAMGNGHPEAKKHADYIAGHADQDGVYHALVDLGLIDAH